MEDPISQKRASGPDGLTSTSSALPSHVPLLRPWAEPKRWRLIAQGPDAPPDERVAIIRFCSSRYLFWEGKRRELGHAQLAEIDYPKSAKSGHRLIPMYDTVPYSITVLQPRIPKSGVICHRLAGDLPAKNRQAIFRFVYSFQLLGDLLLRQPLARVTCTESYLQQDFQCLKSNYHCEDKLAAI